MAIPSRESVEADNDAAAARNQSNTIVLTEQDMDPDHSGEIAEETK